MTPQEWVSEIIYIDHIADMEGKTIEMDYDPEIALAYCRMQLLRAEKDGQVDAATSIRHAIDDITAAQEKTR